MACLYVVQRAALRGISSEEILEQLNLPAEFFSTASNHSVADILPRVLVAANRLTGDPQFCLDAAKTLHPCLFGSCGLAASHAPSLGRMLGTFAEFGNQLGRWYELSSSSGKDQASWCLSFTESSDEEVFDYAAVSWAATITSFGRLCVGGAFAPIGVSLTQPAPDDRTLYDDFFGVPVEFEAGQNEITISQKDLDADSQLHDPLLFEQLLFTASVLKQQLQASSITDAVDQAIYLGAFDLSEIARALRMTDRTIQRHLKIEGTTFQERLDAIRLKMANTYLQLPSLTVAEIASRIGFSSDKAFRTAYRRWTGRSPREAELFDESD